MRTERQAKSKFHRRAIIAALIAGTVVQRVAAEPSGGEGGAPPVPATAAADSPLSAIAWLADSCWTGTFADGETKDFVCYDWRLGKKFLRSRHRVIGGAGPYSGETIFALNPTTKKFEFAYYNSPGGIIRGEFEPTAAGIDYPIEKVEMGDTSFDLRSVWRREGNDRYVAITEKREGDGWLQFMRIEFVRSGPLSDWREGE